LTLKFNEEESKRKAMEEEKRLAIENRREAGVAMSPRSFTDVAV